MKIQNMGQKYVTPQSQNMARPVPPAARPCHPSEYSFAAFASRTSYLLVYF